MEIHWSHNDFEILLIFQLPLADDSIFHKKDSLVNIGFCSNLSKTIYNTINCVLSVIK